MSGELTWLWWTLAAAAAVAVVAVWWILRKGRPFTTGDVFRASRFSRGKQEQTIHIAHVASVNIDTGILLSNVLIETSGGSDPIACHGHRKGDAVRIKELIERYQTAHYREVGPPGSPAGPQARRPVVPGPNGR